MGDLLLHCRLGARRPDARRGAAAARGEVHQPVAALPAAGGPTPATSAPGLGSPPPHLHRDCAQTNESKEILAGLAPLLGDGPTSRVAGFGPETRRWKAREEVRCKALYGGGREGSTAGRAALTDSPTPHTLSMPDHAWPVAVCALRDTVCTREAPVCASPALERCGEDFLPRLQVIIALQEKQSADRERCAVQRIQSNTQQQSVKLRCIHRRRQARAVPEFGAHVAAVRLAWRELPHVDGRNSRL